MISKHTIRNGRLARSRRRFSSSNLRAAGPTHGGTSVLPSAFLAEIQFQPLPRAVALLGPGARSFVLTPGARVATWGVGRARALEGGVASQPAGGRFAGSVQRRTGGALFGGRRRWLLHGRCRSRKGIEGLRLRRSRSVLFLDFFARGFGPAGFGQVGGAGAFERVG